MIATNHFKDPEGGKMLQNRWIPIVRRALFFSLLIAFAVSGAPGRQGETKKVWAGKSFRSQTVVQAAPSPSAAAGFDSERVWSGEDDWEPAVAADPSSNYVYQMTTRYSGQKACSGC